MNLPLTKTLDPADLSELESELKIVDRHFQAESQHPYRRWEYAMALRGYQQWAGPRSPQGNKRGMSFYDVGGAGSTFEAMLHDSESAGIWPKVVDPKYNEWGKTLAECVAVNQVAVLGDAVFCLSVLEHVDDLDQFLYHLSCLTAPGGLLFLTMDACDQYMDDWPEDRYHFHWMRKRIFNRYGWQVGVMEALRDHDCDPFGDADWAYHGDHVYDYSFCSLAMIKRS